MCLVRARVGSGLRSCGVRIPQCAFNAPGHSRPTPWRALQWPTKAPTTHPLGVRAMSLYIPEQDHPQPWIQDGLKGDSRAAASPCRLRWPRCRGRRHPE
jgi:hypothetical protein